MFARHHDSLVGEERHGLRSVDDHPHLVLVAVELVDHDRPIAVSHEFVHEIGDGRTHE